MWYHVLFTISFAIKNWLIFLWKNTRNKWSLTLQSFLFPQFCLNPKSPPSSNFTLQSAAHSNKQTKDLQLITEIVIYGHQLIVRFPDPHVSRGTRLINRWPGKVSPLAAWHKILASKPNLEIFCDTSSALRFFAKIIFQGFYNKNPTTRIPNSSACLSACHAKGVTFFRRARSSQGAAKF